MEKIYLEIEESFALTPTQDFTIQERKKNDIFPQKKDFQKETVFCVVIHFPQEERHTNVVIMCVGNCLRERKNVKYQKKINYYENKKNRRKFNFGKNFLIKMNQKKNNKRKKVIKTFPFPINNSCFKAEIEEFKKKGGVIKKLPPQLNGEIPGVNVSNLSGWSIETLIGFGYEVRLMEELSTTSEVIDAN